MSLREGMCCEHPLRSYARLFLSSPFPSHPITFLPTPRLVECTENSCAEPEHSSHLASSYTRERISPSLTLSSPVLPIPSFFCIFSSPQLLTAHLLVCPRINPVAPA